MRRVFFQIPFRSFPFAVAIVAVPLSLAVVPVAVAQSAPTIRLATPSGSTESTFNRVSSIRELPNGSLLVADQGDQQLWHATFDGKSAQNIGRKGSGPGEFRTVGWLYAIGRDSSLFTDGYTSRWNIARGTTFTATLSEARELNRSLGAELSGADTLGNVLGVIPFSHRAGVPALRNTADSLYAVRGRWDGSRQDTIASLRGRGGAGFSVTQPQNGGLGRINVANPLSSEDLVVMAPDGWVAIVRVSPYRVDWRAPTGAIRQGTPVAIVARPVDEREVCWALARALGPKTPCDRELAPGWPTHVPAFVPSSRPRPQPTALPTANGQLLVAREPAPAARTQSYDIFDRTSRRVAQLEIPITDAVVGFGARSVYVLRVDDDGLSAILRYNWPVQSAR
jgi:hypothetical protein